MEVSKLTLRRLALYLNHLWVLKENGIENFAAPAIEKQLGIHHTQVRKDLKQTGLIGKAKIGHNVIMAIESIEKYLGWDKKQNRFIIGAGNLGRSLAGYSYRHFPGMDIVALFDNNPVIVGRIFQEIPVFDIKDLDYFAQKLNPSIGIITTPPEEAQKCADLLMASNIKAIWNFTTAKLNVPKNIIVETTCLSSSLAVLSHKLTNIEI